MDRCQHSKYSNGSKALPSSHSQPFSWRKNTGKSQQGGWPSRKTDVEDRHKERNFNFRLTQTVRRESNQSTILFKKKKKKKKRTKPGEPGSSSLQNTCCWLYCQLFGIKYQFHWKEITAQTIISLKNHSDAHVVCWLLAS